MKKINSEIKFPNDYFKFKIGTTNKKHPETIYIEIGTYLIPSIPQESYSDDFNSIERKAKHRIKSIIAKTNVFDHNFIFINDIATDRMTVGKKSYLEMQIYLKPRKSILESKTFKELAEQINTEYASYFMTEISLDMVERGYILSKTKLGTIYKEN